MKQKNTKSTAFLIVVSLAVSLAFSIGGTGYGQSGASSKPSQQAKEFEDRVKEYVKMREQLEEKLPKLSKEAKPEEIEAHKNTFQEMVRSARAGAKPGAVFTPEAARHIRAIIKREFKGKDLKELRETVFEAENKGVPLRVNYPYPVTKEVVEMPPTLLLALPQLPKQMRYRFVGKNMLLVDRENGLIIDYMVNALP